MAWGKTEWRPFFVLMPRRIEGRWTWFRTAYWREDDKGAWTCMFPPSGVEYKL